MNSAEVEAQIVQDANRLLIEMAVYRKNRAPAPVNVQDYGTYAVRHEALIRRRDDAQVLCGAMEGSSMGPFELLTHALYDMARATTSSWPEEPFQLEG